MKQGSKVDEGWIKVLSYLENKYENIVGATITAKEINDIAPVEARIMCKFDDYSSYPEILKQANLFVLPIKNGIYQMVKGNGFHKIEYSDQPIKEYISNIEFEILTSRVGISEKQHLDIARNSGLIEYFIDRKLIPTIRGRKYCSPFEFQFNRQKLMVQSVQVEVDAGLEGKDVVVIFEAKSGKPDYFNIRQLYYPYRFWGDQAQGKKLIPVFFLYDNETGIYSFWKYEFTDKMDYHSLRLVEHKKFIILQTETKEALKPSIEMVPQANTMNTLIELVQEVARGTNDSLQIAEKFEFDRRQSSYYRQAAEMLKLAVFGDDNKYFLTFTGKEFLKQSKKKQFEMIFQLISEIPIVQIIQSEIEKNPEKKLSRKEIARIVENNTHLNLNTSNRRVSTLYSWYKYLMNKIDIPIYVEGGYIGLVKGKDRTLDEYFEL